MRYIFFVTWSPKITWLKIMWLYGWKPLLVSHNFACFNGHRHRGSGYNMLYSHNFKWLLSFWSLWLTVGKSIIKITSLTNFFCQMIQNRKTWWKIYYSLVSNQENENHQTISNKNLNLYQHFVDWHFWLFPKQNSIGLLIYSDFRGLLKETNCKNWVLWVEKKGDK